MTLDSHDTWQVLKDGWHVTEMFKEVYCSFFYSEDWYKVFVVEGVEKGVETKSFAKTASHHL